MQQVIDVIIITVGSTMEIINNDSANYSQSNEEQMDSSTDVEIENHQPTIILAVLWKYGKVAACYYNVSQKILYTYLECIDLEPKYPTTQSMLRELSPHHVITIGNTSDSFVIALIDILTNNDGNVTLDSNLRKVPSNLTLLDTKEFSYNACQFRVKNLRLESEPDAIDESVRLMYITSLINLDSTNTMHMLGALVKFLENSWRNLRTSHGDDLMFLHIKQLSLKDHVYIDNTTFNALNVFNIMNHDSNFKHGGHSSSREGQSLFKLLSQHCISKLGLLKLRDLLKTPLKNIKELEKRYEFMDFIVNPRHSGIRSSLSENIRKIVMVGRIFHKLQHSQGNTGHWKSLYQTIFAILQIKEYIKPYLSKCTVFADMSNSISDNLYYLETCIESSLDFESKTWRQRPVVKEGIDKDLDEAKARYGAIKNRLIAAARTVVNHLPGYMEECTVFYVPDMGHIISVRKWSPNCHPEDLLQFGCYYLFELNEVYHYKSALCQELDTQLGDLPAEIQDHENRIIQRIAKYVLKENIHILNPLQDVALMDALMSMAKVGADRHFVRPTFNTNNTLEIRNGRHPLLELANPNYVPNDFNSGGEHSAMKIITGPNASGKSMYLKQTSLLVYMVHVGSYIPATSANITMVHSIHTRMHATESAALNMSAFVIDLSQMANALYNAKESSLVVMDEFGRGTTGSSSKALLLGALRKFLNQNKYCPHVMISTHMYLEKEYLESPLVLYQKMDHARDEETQTITFLYKIVEGESSSFTFEMAGNFLGTSILNRAKEILAMMHAEQNGTDTSLDVAFFENVRIPKFND